MIKNINSLIESYRDWVVNESLDVVVVNVHRIYLNNPKYLNGEIFGLYAKRLIDSEIEIGGPYLSPDDLYTNVLIMKQFRTLGAPLENLEFFLRNKAYKAKNVVEKAALKLVTIKNKSPISNEKIHAINRAIIISKKKIEEQPSIISTLGLNFLDKIIELDKRLEISKISTYLLQSLSERPKNKDLELSYLLGSANIYAWIAYTIYDDFIDDEGHTELLSLANIMHRYSYETYRTLYPHMDQLINGHFDSVDISNLWELQYCRAKVSTGKIFINNIPQYKKGEFLAKRSIGHVLGPKLLICRMDLTATQKSLLNEALNHYLIAKQINDDIQDWKNDIKNGHLNYVVSKLLISTKTTAGDYEIDKLINKLDVEFWNNALNNCLLEVIFNLKESDNKLRETKLFRKNNQFLSKILNPLKNEVEDILYKHQNDKKFLESYSKT